MHFQMATTQVRVQAHISSTDRAALQVVAPQFDGLEEGHQGLRGGDVLQRSVLGDLGAWHCTFSVLRCAQRVDLHGTIGRRAHVVLSAHWQAHRNVSAASHQVH